MANFMIRFLICNVFISGIIGILLIAKRIFKNNLSSRMQYNLWFLLLGLLAVPFIPFRPIGFPQIFSWLGSLRSSPASGTSTAMGEAVGIHPTGNTDWMNDFALSVNSETPSIAGYILLGIWIVGIFAMIILVIKSSLRLRNLEKSALPLQNPEVRRLYYRCLEEMGIHRNIPIYSTAFLKSPIIVGLLKPCIYLPIHLISDYNESDMRYMLLHELQHYKHKDAIASYLMNLTGVIYWFNPLVWYALKEMRNDREVACDTSVLKMLEEDAYEDYGNTLINFAEKVSLTPFPFAAGLGGNMEQMKRRIINIASYEKPTFIKRVKGVCSYFLIACLLLTFMPMLSVNAAIEIENTYQINKNDSNISYIDLSSYFNDYQGCFVLFDATTDSWQIYNKVMAQKRISPDSTYKIYSALLGLENRYITSASSEMTWNGQEYPIAAWNANQNLTTAFQNSVNWYFQSLDQVAGLKTLEDFYTYINYGNHDLSGGVSSFWAESSLKISPIEQVEMLQRLYINDFNFDADNIQTVKNALLLSSTADGNLYGKTGTGNINGENISGWFIGYVETSDNTYFFALNIGATENATGSKASDIALSILSDMNIWY